MLSPVMARRLLALLAAGAALAACAQPTAGRAGAAPGPAPASAAPNVQAPFYDQQLSWGPCRPFATTDDDAQAYADPSLSCARMTVPLDYTQPSGSAAQIGVLRHRATGSRIGSLVVNPGGPGASGMSQAASLAGSKELAGSPVLARFDLVGFDPRGVGASTPAIRCLSDSDWTAERADLDVDPSPAGVAQTEAENKDFAAKCVARSGGTQVLANVGTRDVVKDLDVLRAVLGDAKLTYLGYSYGTRIGTLYAEAFPANVRAMVLDGALDPEQSVVDRNVDQYQGFQQAFQAYADDCARNPACPLGTDSSQATARYQALVRPLITKPLAVGSRTLSYTDAITGTVFPLYLKEYWPYLSLALSRYAAGDGRSLLALADFYYDRSPSGQYGNSMDAFQVISCVDDDRVTDRATVLDQAERILAAAPFEDPGLGPVAALDRCAYWPVPPTGGRHNPDVQGLPTVLVVSTTGDPATPYAAGVALAKELGASLLTFEGTQHTISLQGLACVDQVVTDYLVTASKPPDGRRCSSP